MKKIIRPISLLLLAFISYSVFAQDNNSAIPEGRRPHATVIGVQAGSAHLINGACTIVLDAAAPVETYFVAITPHGSSNGLYVVKSKDSFIIKGITGTNATDIDFDYVIFRNPELPGAQDQKAGLSPDRRR
jgi:hypothetical protein